MRRGAASSDAKAPPFLKLFIDSLGGSVLMPRFNDRMRGANVTQCPLYRRIGRIMPKASANAGRAARLKVQYLGGVASLSELICLFSKLLYAARYRHSNV